jgi:hypothetical protein
VEFEVAIGQVVMGRGIAVIGVNQQRFEQNAGVAAPVSLMGEPLRGAGVAAVVGATLPHTARIGAGIGTNLASLRRFWAVAAR